MQGAGFRVYGLGLLLHRSELASDMSSKRPKVRSSLGDEQVKAGSCDFVLRGRS